ncbi:cell wall hydrolase [Clostridium sp. MT-14]|uniref:Cell wall hydrolase n=1 Tax=Clostridium aromativorans TaxID=2836848 RepID=A0ABS8N682_9CLOT|nr:MULTISPECIES: cell wall hydrolase [Clostridium]KAA8680586.1 cell wall hydrolase [Clostridium sp. HV4-5-A1G]MCC9295309.1 cell wall hydrolase [Clostridium aromativorans]CAB1261718.1 Spore cortex-lytic enzyme [Clostridiaceae bacterium BL-3]
MKKFFYFIILFLMLFMPLQNVSSCTLNNANSTLFNEQEEVVQVFNYSDQKIPITQDDVNLMAKVVYAESNCEPFEGKVAVASVILNRLQYPEFPKTVKGVVTQKGAFSCVRNGTIDVVANKDSYNAVLQALKGVDPTNKSIFFYNPKIATSQWMKNIRKKNVKSIGNHVFFVVN